MLNEGVVKYFANELQLINDKQVREPAEALLGLAPEYFLKIPSSTTGKYHPIDENCEGGKAIHVKRVVWLVHELCAMDASSSLEHDLAIAAALVHDLFFKDIPEQKHSVDYHPGLIRKYTAEASSALPHYADIVAIAERHSGRWEKNPELRPQQKLMLDKMLHIADYVASRRPVHISISNAIAPNPKKG